MDNGPCGQFQRMCSKLNVVPNPQIVASLAAGVQQSVLSVESCGGPDPVTDDNVVPLCLILKGMTSQVVRLSLSGQIACKGATLIASILQVNPSITELLLPHNQIGDQGAAAIGASVGQSSLQALDLTHNQITDSGLRMMVKGLSVTASQTLQVMLLEGNHFTTAGCSDFIQAVERERLPVLQELSLQPAAEAGGFSDEVQAALAVVCEMHRVTLRRGSPASAPVTREDPMRDTWSASAVASPQESTNGGPGEPALDRCDSLFSLPMVRSGAPDPLPYTGRSTRSMPAFGASVRSTSADGRNQFDTRSHQSAQGYDRGWLGIWMADLERKVRDMNQIVVSAVARLDSKMERMAADVAVLQAASKSAARQGTAAERSPAGSRERRRTVCGVSPRLGEDGREKERMAALEAQIAKQQAAIEKLEASLRMVNRVPRCAEDSGSRRPSLTPGIADRARRGKAQSRAASVDGKKPTERPLANGAAELTSRVAALEGTDQQECLRMLQHVMDALQQGLPDKRGKAT
mmetsp:Transcript_19521/g.47141  ORF Transcript_19521/g.47141 Transcript_19521/m.47141 type:complete len:520 (+) Transcript_19521:27-1586(+)